MSIKKGKKNEIRCARQQVLVSRTDLKGDLIYYNPSFLEVNGYKGESLMHRPHNIVRHPDMPKTIFRIIWKIIQEGLPIKAIVKNRTKDGKYYWGVINWKVQKDRNDKIVSYVAHARQAPTEAIKAVEPLYDAMLNIEEINGMDSAEEYLHGYLEEKGVTYGQYMKNLTKHREIKCLCDIIFFR